MFERLRDIWKASGTRYRDAKPRRGRREAALSGKRSWTDAENAGRLATRLKRKGVAAAMADSMARDAEANPDVGAMLLERVIGDNDFLDVSFLTLGAWLSKGVARVQIRSAAGRVLGHGSGFMVSADLFMTNNHVLEDLGQAASSVAQFDYVEHPGGHTLQMDEFRFEPSRFFRTDEDLDFTLVAVAPQSQAGAALAARPWNPLIRESGKALVGEPVNIIQHPRGGTMKVACRQNKIVDRLPNFLHYAADTEPGSSGSAVCNDRWEIAALHHSSVPATDARGRILLTDGSVWNGRASSRDRISWVANEGVRISKIVGHLDALQMTAAEQTLYDRCFDQTPAVREAAAGAAQGAPATSHTAPFHRQEADGSASWYFRVNFGPAGTAGAAPPIAPAGGRQSRRRRGRRAPPAPARPPARIWRAALRLPLSSAFGRTARTTIRLPMRPQQRPIMTASTWKAGAAPCSGP